MGVQFLFFRLPISDFYVGPSKVQLNLSLYWSMPGKNLHVPHCETLIPPKHQLLVNGLAGNFSDLV